MKPLSKQQSLLSLHPTTSSILGVPQLNQSQQNNNSFMVTTQNLHSQMSSQTTSSETNNKKSINQIHQLYSQIHSTINDMDTKVQHVIKKHEAEFLFAYRNHIKKIKKQLSEIKYKSEQQEKMFSSNDRIQYLEQELAIFRQQTMKIYNKLDQKNAQLDILKIKLKDMQKETSHANNQLRQQYKKNMISEMNKVNLQEKVNELEIQLERKNNQIQKLSFKLSQFEDSKSSIKPQSTLGSKLFNHDFLKKGEHSRTSPLSKDLRSPIRSLNSSIHVTTTNFYNFKSSQSSRIYDSDLKQWFLECVKTVKRQIAQRKNNQKSLQLNNITSIDEFMLIDKLRLLQIFLENQRLLTYMYERIFPDRLTTLRQKLSQSKQVILPKSSMKEPSILTERQQRVSSFNQDLINDRYKTQIKITNLPKVIGRVSEHKQKISQKNKWKGNVILKDGKLNISML